MAMEEGGTPIGDPVGTGCPNYDLMSQTLAKITIRSFQLMLNFDLLAMAVKDFSATTPCLF